MYVYDFITMNMNTDFIYYVKHTNLFDENDNCLIEKVTSKTYNKLSTKDVVMFEVNPNDKSMLLVLDN